jgi:hypothetical protein
MNKLPPPPSGFEPPPKEAQVSDDYKDGASHPTLQMPKVSVPESGLNAILTELRSMRQETTFRLDKIEADVGLVASEMKVVQGRVANLEEARRIDEARARRHSDGVKKVGALSSSDESQNAAIGKLMSDVNDLRGMLNTNTAETMAVKTALAKNTEATLVMKRVLVDDVKGFFKEHPEVAHSLRAFILAVLGYVTAHLATKGGHW